MKPRRSYKLDFCIGLIALAALVYFVYGLNKSLNSVEPVRSVEARKVGKMVVLSPGVRVKTLEDYSWYPINDGASVYTGDTVFTGSDSKAVLSLGSNGGEIRLEPFSLVTISEREGLAEITLHFGEFESELKGGGLVVNADGDRSVVQADEAAVRLKKDTQELNIQVLRGDVTVDKHGNSVRLQESQDLSLAEVAPPQPDFTIIAPPPEAPAIPTEAKVYQVPVDPEVTYSNGLYKVPPKHALNLNWEAPEKHGDFEVVFAKDEEFKEVLSVRKFDTPDVSMMVIPQSGFYWKVRTQSDAGNSWSEYSPPSKVEVSVPAFVAKPSAPVIQVLDEEKAVAVQEFDPYPGVEQFEVQVKSDKDKDWKSTLITSPRLRIPGARGQDAAWRVRPLSSEGEPVGAFSEPVKISFGEELFTPKLSPEQEARQELRAQVLSRPPVLRGPARQETFVSFGKTPAFVVFDWKADNAVENYEIQIAKDEAFQSIVTESVVDKPMFVFTGVLEPGIYFWRVRSSMDGETSPWSAAKSLRFDNR
jgi:hypothetical protein